MPTLNWLKSEFGYGYDSGNILSLIPGRVRFSEERRSGGSYRRVFKKAVLPYLRPEFRVLELGPGKGSWSRAILNYIPQGELHTVDFQDVSAWLKPESFSMRLTCHQVQDNTFAEFPDDYFDFFWSFGVLCHNEGSSILNILRHARRIMRPGARCVHQYGDWNKLDRFGWGKGGVPRAFINQKDHDIWWPRNNQGAMSKIATEAGWKVEQADMNLLRRDSIISLRKA